jgi:hypothetical protein
MTKVEIYQPAIDALEREACSHIVEAEYLRYAIKRLKWHAGILEQEPEPLSLWQGANKVGIKTEET